MREEPCTLEPSDHLGQYQAYKQMLSQYMQLSLDEEAELKNAPEHSL